MCDDAQALVAGNATAADLAAAAEALGAAWFLMDQASAVASCVRDAMPEVVPDHLVQRVGRAMTLGDAVGELLTLAKDKCTDVERVIEQARGRLPHRSSQA